MFPMSVLIQIDGIFLNVSFNLVVELWHETFPEKWRDFCVSSSSRGVKQGWEIVCYPILYEKIVFMGLWFFHGCHLWFFHDCHLIHCYTFMNILYYVVWRQTVLWSRFLASKNNFMVQKIPQMYRIIHFERYSSSSEHKILTITLI